MIDKGEYLKLRLDNLYVKRGKDEFTIPLSDISVILIENLDAILTTRLLEACTQNNVVVVTCDYKHQPIGIYNGLNTNSRASKIMKQQINWTDDFKDATWKTIIISKLTNQRDLLVMLNKKKESFELINSYIHDLKPGDTTNREGHSAKVYFNELFGLEFTRDSDDIFNSCLDYIYSVVRALFTRLIVVHGFCGMIGVHHKSEYNNFNLVDDLMEPFRPFCDKYVLSICTSDSIFNLDMREMLVDFLNIKIIYNKKNTFVVNAIENYMFSFMRYCKSGDQSDIVFPYICDNG